MREPFGEYPRMESLKPSGVAVTRTRSPASEDRTVYRPASAAWMSPPLWQRSRAASGDQNAQSRSRGSSGFSSVKSEPSGLTVAGCTPTSSQAPQTSLLPSGANRPQETARMGGLGFGSTCCSFDPSGLIVKALGTPSGLQRLNEIFPFAAVELAPAGEPTATIPKDNAIPRISCQVHLIRYLPHSGSPRHASGNRGLSPHPPTDIRPLPVSHHHTGAGRARRLPTDRTISVSSPSCAAVMDPSPDRPTEAPTKETVTRVNVEALRALCLLRADLVSRWPVAHDGHGLLGGIRGSADRWTPFLSSTASTERS